MKDNLNRKSEDESNKMLREPSEIYKKTIETLKKKYGYTDKQIGSHFVIPQDFDNFELDLAIFTKEDDKNPKIVGEIKIGNFVFPFAQYQLEKYMNASNAKYGFLTNGKEWINYELLNNKIIRTSDIPTSKELQSIISGKTISKKFTQLSDASYILKKILDSLLANGIVSSEVFLELLSFKLYDEIHEKNKNFKKIADFPETHLEVFDSLRKKIKIEKQGIINDRPLFSFDQLKISSHLILPQIIELANFSLTKSNPVEISKFLVTNALAYEKQELRSSNSAELVEFLYNLLELTDKNKILVSYSGPQTLVHLLGLLHSNFPKNSKKNILVIEPKRELVLLLHVISQLSLPKFEIIHRDPRHANLTSLKFDHIISNPPLFGLLQNKPEGLGDYGSDEIRYYIKHLTNYPRGTKISVVVPQNFLFNSSPYGKKIRKYVLDTCTLLGIIQLPKGYSSSNSVQSSLLLLEVGTRDLINYNIFMAVLSKPTKTISEINKKLSLQITKSYHDFLKGKPIKNPTQNGFVVKIDEIIENGWTVSDKIPELKQMLDVPFKERILDSVQIFQGISVPTEKHFSEKTYSFIRISDIKNNFIKKDKIKKIYLDKESLLKYKKFFIKKGDILLSSKGTIGKSIIINKDYEDYLASSQLLILRPDTKKILSEYLYDLLNSEVVKTQIHGIVRGISIPFLPKSEFEKIIISVPPLQKQKEKVFKSLKLQEEISELEAILDKKRRDLQDSRDNE